MFYCPMCNAKISVSARSCEKCGYILRKDTPSPTATPSSRPGLIRPVGATPPIHVPNPALPLQPNLNTTGSPQTLPVTPPTLSALHPPALHNPTPNVPPPQFIRPAFLPSKGQKPNTKQIPGQQGPQVPVQQISPAQQLPPQYAPALSSQTGQAPTAPTTQTPSELRTATPHPIEIVKGRPQLIDTDEQFEQFEDGAESYVATSVAAEHWRTSWRNRQRSEAGPATDVSRGHSSVPEPLLAMQHSLMNMRAIIAPDGQKEGASPGLWIAIVLMLFLIIGLGVYIASTFAPN